MKANHILTKGEAEALLSQRGQPHLVKAAAFTVSALTNPANKIPLRGLYFRAPAGAGKSTTARFIADITGAEFWEVPAGIRLPELISGNEDKGFPGLSHVLNYERSAGPKVLYFEEFAQAKDEVKTFVLDLADVAKSPGGDKWGIVRERTLLCIGTNEGVANSAIAGPSGRFLDVPLEHLSRQEKLAKFRQLSGEYGCQMKGGALQALDYFSAPTHRSVENAAYAVFAGESTVNAAAVISRFKPDAVEGKRTEAVCGPYGMTALCAEILRALVRAERPLRAGTLKSEAGAGEALAKVWGAAFAEAKARKWVYDITGGFVATPLAREQAKEFAAELSRIRALDVEPEAKKPAGKKPAGKKPAGKGGAK